VLDSPAGALEPAVPAGAPAPSVPDKTDRVYRPEDLAAINFDPHHDVGEPGSPPYTRGREADLYRDQLWVMGQYSGFSSVQATNLRFKELLEKGQTGFSVALDLPTQMGLDSDHPLSDGEIGKVGVPLNTLRDMEALLDGIELGRIRQIRTTANAIGPIVAAMVIVAAEKQGIDPNSFRMMFQNDPLKEYVARGTYIFPPEYGMRFACDLVEYCAINLPRWEPIEFCGYHIRDSGCEPYQELGLTVANGLTYVAELSRRGLHIDQAAHNTVLFLSADLRVLAEAAKFRAARRLWATLMRERYAAGPEAQKCSIFCYTLGGSLTAQEPMNNVVRVAYQALAAALGGVQTLATSSYDEALGLPSSEAVHIALRTQQIVGYETDATSTVDPLAGSYYVEYQTTQIEVRARELLDDIEARGGVVHAIDTGYLQQLIEDSSYRAVMALERGETVKVGVNRWVEDNSGVTVQPSVRPDGRDAALASLAHIKATRDTAAVRASLVELDKVTTAGENTMQAIVAAVRAYATMGEITDILRRRWGEHDRRHTPHLQPARD
jgi:methylmalonyl-CoA mutase, N-terminal domain